MKRVLLASTALLAASLAPAFADGGMSNGGSWYAAIGGGANLLGTPSLDNAASTRKLEPDFDTGWALSGSVGYRWTCGLRTEVEASYRRNEAGSTHTAVFGDIDLDGDTSQYAVMANVLYDFRVGENLTLSLGGGVGLADADTQISIGPTWPYISDLDHSWSFAWQLIGGVSYSLSPNTEFFVEYHYFRNDGNDVITNPMLVPLETGMDMENQTVMVGVRFAFGR
jgi:opacity protein-like surface antigen